MTKSTRPAPYKGIPGRYMPKARARNIHAFHNAAFWLTASVPFFAFPMFWIMTGDPVKSLGASSAALVFVALLSCTITDLMSMRIPNNISILPVVAALMWWTALYFGMTPTDGLGYGRVLYAPMAPDIGGGAIIPEIWTGALYKDIIMSFIAAVLVFIPLLLSFIIGAMGGGDAKFMPPFALYLGWSLGFDFLFLTFLFGGVFAIGMIIIRKAAVLLTRSKPGRHPEIERIANMRHFAYAPAIAAAGLVCLAAKWEGILG